MWPVGLLFQPSVWSWKSFPFRLWSKKRKSLSLFRFMVYLSWPLFPLRGRWVRGGGVHSYISCKQTFFSDQTQRRAPLNCRRSRRSCQRLWERWRNETRWCLCWKSRGWGRGLRTGTWKAWCSPRATNSTGPRRMMDNSRRNELTEQVYLSIFQKNVGDFYLQLRRCGLFCVPRHMNELKSQECFYLS